jgi:hypothetical protein
MQVEVGCGNIYIYIYIYIYRERERERWPNLSRIKQETIKTQIEGYNL